MPIPSTSAYTHRTIHTGEVPIHVAEVANGRKPLVLLHGIGMDWRVWQGVSRRLRQHFHLYLVDLRGHGHSGKPKRGYTLAHYAADIEDLIDAFGLSDIALLGSSLGGMVSAVVEAPVDVVSHRILVDPPMTGGPIRDPEGFETILRLKHRPVSELAAHLRDGNPSLSAHLAHIMSQMWHESADGVLVELLANEDDYFAIDSALASIDSPTLLMRADPQLHPALTAERAQGTLHLLPHGEEQVIHGAGHAIHADRPDDFVRSVTRFVQEAPVR